MLRRIGLAALLSIGMAGPANGQASVRADRILAASDLHNHCSASENTEAGRLSMGYCLGAIAGIADATMTLNAFLSGEQTVCLRPSDTAEKIRLSFLSFAEQRPETLDLPAATVLIAVLQSNFRCET